MTQLGSTQARLHEISSDATLIRDSNADPSHKVDIFNLGNHSQVIPQKTPITLLSSFLTLLRSYSTFLLQFSTKQYITKIHCKYLMTSL